MKRLALIISSIVLALVCLFPIKSSTVLAETTSKNSTTFDRAYFSQTLKDFLGENDTHRYNRTALTSYEKQASQYLIDKLKSFGYSDAYAQEFRVESVDLTSQNVIATYGTGDKKIVVGAHYDNVYQQIPNSNVMGNKGASVLQGATGVSVLLGLAEFLQESAPTLDYRVELVFFGANEVGCIGSQAYIDKIGINEINNTLCMINLDKIGGDNLYLYTDEVKTKHGSYILDKSAQLNIPLLAFPKNVPIINTQIVKNISYMHAGLNNDHIFFMQRNVPVAQLIGGYYGGINTANTDSKKIAKISGTSDDDLAHLTGLYPNYDLVMANAFQILSNIVVDNDFVSSVIQAKKEVGSYKFWMNTTVARIVFLSLIVVLMIVLVVLVKYFEKKYPYEPKIKRLKIAVFGMDYEQDTDEDVYVDIKNPNTKSPFDGY